jgi:hypothetical protein
MLSSTKSTLILGTSRFQTARSRLSSLAAWTSFLVSTRMIVPPLLREFIPLQC